MARLRAISNLMTLASACAWGHALIAPAFASDAPTFDTVRLRAAAIVTDASALTLADIATIEGPNAAALASIPIPAHAGGTVRIELALVRAALEASPDADPARLALSGSAVHVRVEPPKSQPASTTRAPASPALPVGPTVRDAVAGVVAQSLGVAPDGVRLTFDEGDASLLNTPTQGRTHTLAPTAQGDRVPLHCRVYEDDRLVASGTFRVGVRVRRQVAVAVRTIERGQPIGEGDVAGEERWLSPTTRAVSPENAIGLTARARLDAGEPVEERQVESPLAITRGDRVTVDCVSGGVVVRAVLRAKTDGRVGEVIELLPLAPQRARAGDRASKMQTEPVAMRTSVRARVAGPGRAVLLTDDPSEPIASAESTLREILP